MVERRCEDPKGNGAIKSWRQENRESAEEDTRCNDCQSREVGYLPIDELTIENLYRTGESSVTEKRPVEAPFCQGFGALSPERVNRYGRNFP
jgi:hypothetical protein